MDDVQVIAFGRRTLHSMRVPSTSSLPRLSAAGFSIISFNVLLPNSQDGWWLYKYYDGDVPLATTEWPARSKLLADRLLGADADIVLLQECCADSFDTDWSFLLDAGYESALYSKGRMRPATFWKKDRMALCDAAGEPVNEPPAGMLHGDRTLTTMLRLRDEAGALAARPPLYIVNCHLSAGPEARRRLRQTHDALESIKKARNKLKVSADAPPPCVVLAGDFNSQGRSGVRQLLEHTEVLPDFRESGDPTEVEQEKNEVTSKPKKQVIGKFVDAMELAYRDATDVSDAVEVGDGAGGGSGLAQAGATAAQAGGPPPTIVAMELMSHMVDASGEATPALLAAVDECFDKLSADGATLSDDEQTAWLLKINGKVGRGSEFRMAVAAREARDGAPLTRADFRSIYVAEMQAGKFWGVEHDIRVLRGHGMRAAGSAPFAARFDTIYFTCASLSLAAVQEALPADKMEALLMGKEILPNAWHASDHLPVAAAVRFENVA